MERLLFLLSLELSEAEWIMARALGVEDREYVEFLCLVELRV